MTIKTVIKKEETIEKEIQLPYFCKLKGCYWIKILNEDSTVIVYWNDEGSNGIRLSPIWLQTTDISLSEPCTEQEFNEAYHKALFEIGKYVPAPEVPKELLKPAIDDYIEYLKAKVEIGEEPLSYENWAELNEILNQ